MFFHKKFGSHKAHISEQFVQQALNILTVNFNYVVEKIYDFVTQYKL